MTSIYHPLFKFDFEIYSKMKNSNHFFLGISLGVLAPIIFTLMFMPFSKENSNTFNKNIKAHFAKMIYLEGGKFTMGRMATSKIEVTPADSFLFIKQSPTRAEVAPFYISATEVTNAEWRQFYLDKVQELGRKVAKAKYFPDTTKWLNEFPYSYNAPMAKNYFSKPDFNDFPVVGISWEQAEAYCQWKSDKVNAFLKKKGLGKAIEFRLPTEKEWEFAAMKKYDFSSGLDERVVKRSNYAWPEEVRISRINELTNIGQIFDANHVELKAYAEDGCLYTCKVASYPSNDSGLYDMAGNVSEWTSDAAYVGKIFFDDYEGATLYSKAAIEKEIEILKGKIKGAYSMAEFYVNQLQHEKEVLHSDGIKICKGGSWAEGMIYTQPGSRQGVSKDLTSTKIGFRVAISNVDEKLLSYLPKKNWQPQ